MTGIHGNRQDGFVNSGDVDIHYYRTGGDKPPIILLHGATDDGLCWGPLVRSLESDWDVVTLDARGHGLSGSGKGNYCPEIRLIDLLTAMDQLNLNRPVLAGHSMGAESATLVAVRHPDRVRALILEDPALILPGERLFGGPWGRYEDRGRREYQRILRLLKTLPILPARLLARVFNISFPRDEILPWLMSKRRLDNDYLESFLSIGSEELPSYEILGRIDTESLLIIGDRHKGSIISLDEARKAISGRSNIHLIHRRGSDHNIRRFDYDAYIRDVSLFLMRLPN